MLSFKKVVLLTLISASILVPGAVYAKNITNTTNSKSEAAVIYKNGESTDDNLQNKNKDKKQNLKELESYISGSNEQLKQVLTERKELSKQLKTTVENKLGVDTSFMNEFKKIAEDTRNKVKNNQMTKKQAKQYLKDQKKQFDEKYASQIEQLKKARKNYTDKHKDEIVATKQSEKEVRIARKALNDALKSGDAAKVKEAFNNYLSSITAVNNLMKNQINALK